MNKNNKLENRGPGRPKYSPKFPRAAKWTFRQLCEANGIEFDENGKAKGGACTPLTLRKFLDADMFTDAGNPRHNSTIVQVKDDFRKPNHEKGLGRKCFVYSLRNKGTAPVAKQTRKAKVADVTVNVGLSQNTADYEAQKAALLAPTPSVIAPEPEPVIAETPAPEPVAAPVIETPAVETPTAPIADAVIS